MYEKGNEPQELKKHVAFITKELQEAYPEGLITADTWKHEKWDSLVEYLYPKLGYSDSVAFLKAYDFEVFGELNTKPQETTQNQAAERTQRKALSCPQCGSDDIAIDTFQENLGSTTVSNQTFKFKQRGHGLIWWLFIGCWWWMIDLMLWICFFPFRLLAQLFKKKKYKGRATTVSQSINEVAYKKIYTCRSCGNSWSATAAQGSTMSALTQSKQNIKKLQRNTR
ncbi:MAG: hypothetical protein IKQ10_11460 [Oscillospiraceae bacterium]|nr:hypothetical protein [Oscillospiraceae bacterium]